QFSLRFQQEVKLIAKLEHPNILPVYDYGETDGLVYLVMRLVEGGSLSDLIHGGKKLPLPRVSQILTQIASALDHSHRNGIIHRDIKPGNILIDNSNNCLLTDFGIAKVAEANSNFTQTGHVVGTPSYISPELGRGDKIDQRSDVYSLGILLYQMLSGELPFNAETPLAIVLMHVQDPVPSILSKKPDLSPHVEKVLFKALAKDPNERYSSTYELADAFNKAISNCNNTDTEELPSASSHRAADNGSGTKAGATATMAIPKAAKNKAKKKADRKFHPKFYQFLLILMVVVVFSPLNYYQTIDLIDHTMEESGLTSYIDQKVHNLTDEYLGSTDDQSSAQLEPIPEHRRDGGNKSSSPGSLLPPPIVNDQVGTPDQTELPINGQYIAGIISGHGSSRELRLLVFTLENLAGSVSARITDSELIGLIVDKTTPRKVTVKQLKGYWQMDIPVTEEMDQKYLYRIKLQPRGELLVGLASIEPRDPLNILMGGYFVASRDSSFDFQTYQPPSDLGL
ncbi:MAG: serine/threonine protein kinase, partial [Desulfobulbaceae bacterium]|nr:serine/threonine protein kinase [Desulfobulbaceae bacterium]